MMGPPLYVGKEQGCFVSMLGSLVDEAKRQRQKDVILEFD